MDNLALSQGGNFCLNSAALAIGTTTSRIKTAAVLNYVIDGQFYGFSATDNIPVSVSLPATYGVATNGAFTGDPRVVNVGGTAISGSTRLYGIYIDKAGAVTFYPGPVAHAGDLAAGAVALQFPANRKGCACLGALRVQVNGGVSFVPGANVLGGTAANTGLVSYLNLAAIPGEPLRS